jgi:hypothetical protein
MNTEMRRSSDAQNRFASERRGRQSSGRSRTLIVETPHQLYGGGADGSFTCIPFHTRVLSLKKRPRCAPALRSQRFETMNAENNSSQRMRELGN